MEISLETTIKAVCYGIGTLFLFPVLVKLIRTLFPASHRHHRYQPEDTWE